MTTLPTLGYPVFDSYTSTCKLIVHPGKLSLYQAADQWKSFTNIVEGKPVVTTKAPTSVSKSTVSTGGITPTSKIRNNTLS